MPSKACMGLPLRLFLCCVSILCISAASIEQGYPRLDDRQSAPGANPAADALLSCYNANTSAGPSVFNDFVSGKPTRSLRLQQVWWSGRDAGFPLTIFTQIDLSRLRALELQCRSFPGGIIAAAVWAPLVQPQPGDADLAQQNQEALTKARRLVEGLFLRMEAHNAAAAANVSSGGGDGGGAAAAGGPNAGFAVCSLRLLLLSELLDKAALSVLMPINALRNAAMLAVDTPLAAMVDVDLSMSRGLVGHLMENKTRAAEVVRRAEQENVLWVMPAWDTNRTLGYHNRTAMVDAAIAMTPSEKFTRLKAAWQPRLDVFPFAFDRYIPGHNATDFPRWINAKTEYRVAYSRGFEPWFIAARKTLPYYDARFRGYYYNKLLAVRYLALQGRSFWVLPEVWLVHRHHEVTVSSNVWYKKRQKEKAELSAVFDKPMFPNGTTYRDVFNECNKGFYLDTLGRMDAGRYSPLPDAAAQHCRRVLPWWRL